MNIYTNVFRIIVRIKFFKTKGYITVILYIPQNLVRFDQRKWYIQMEFLSKWSIRFMYVELIYNNHINKKKTIWKLKIPLKIKIFMCFF